MASESSTVHVLSKRSISLHRDTFVFWPHPIMKLVLGLNQKIAPVTSAKLYRWSYLIDHAMPRDSFELRPIAVTKLGLVDYSSTPTGPVLSPDSTEPLPPGDYGWFWTDGNEKVSPFFHMGAVRSFEEAKKQAEQFPNSFWVDPLPWYTFPPSFEQSVLQRDKHCFITDPAAASPTGLELGVSWVIPPPWAIQLLSPGETPPPEYISTDNALVLRRDLMVLFHDNAFGVDVDNEYRIVVFRDLGAVTLPSRIHRAGTCVGPADKFLRLHFRRCLMVVLLGGDIKEDYNWQTIAAAAEELGLCGDDAEMAPLDDPRWNTVLGKDLLEHHLRSELAWAIDSESDRD